MACADFGGPEHRCAAFPLENHAISIWDLSTSAREACTCIGHHKRVTCLKLNSDLPLLVSGGTIVPCCAAEYSLLPPSEELARHIVYLGVPFFICGLSAQGNILHAMEHQLMGHTVPSRCMPIQCGWHQQCIDICEDIYLSTRKSFQL